MGSRDYPPEDFVAKPVPDLDPIPEGEYDARTQALRDAHHEGFQAAKKVAAAEIAELRDKVETYETLMAEPPPCHKALIYANQALKQMAADTATIRRDIGSIASVLGAEDD